MRVTVGTFDLTLTGPQTSGPTPTPGSSLSDSIFGGGATSTPTPTVPAISIAGATPTPTVSGATTTVLVNGALVPGQLAGGVADVGYDLPVTAGDQVVIEWHRLAGNVAPLLRVIDLEGVTLAEATTPDPVSRLRLATESELNDLFPDCELGAMAPFGNLCGLPAVCFPNGFGANDLPTSMALLGPAFSEEVLVGAAYRYQQATRWHLQRPPVG